MAGMTIESARARLEVVDGLRRWARGAITDVAAVELLVSTFGGRHARPGVAWVRPCARPGWYWLDADALAEFASTRTGEEQRVLTVAARLVDGDPWLRRRVVNSGRAVA